METLNGLKPEALWRYFEEICQIPRPSKKEEKISAWLMEFARKHGLDARQDEAGNVLMTKPAVPGKEQVPAIVLQSHMDMVCEKNSDTQHDFDKDPIQPYIDGEWVKAKGTTLGADDGIGMAAALAVLTSSDIQHGPVECLFTVDEETGLTGAFASQEEVGVRGATVTANHVKADVAIVFEGCPADDTVVPDYQIQTAIGKGPMLRHIDARMITNPRFQRFALNIAYELGIPVQEAVRTGGSTNGSVINLSNMGVPAIVIGIPVRYAHTHYGISSVSDFSNGVKLAKEIIRRLDKDIIGSF